MNTENAKRVREVAAKIGDMLKGKLPPLHDKPTRNSYAHVWHSVKEKFGASYKELPDELVDEVVEFVESIGRDEENAR